jgi:NitT/TauT family transport system ATP-binding protein
MPDVKIVIDRASKLFLEGTVVAFRNVDLQIKTQEVLCVVGPSGCGKTTLLRCIGGLLPLNSGRILIDDQPVSSPREGIGLQMAGAPRQLIKERTDRYIKLVGLENFEAQYPYQLSGGMQQRVGLARALAINPDILLMDEPFASVDAQTREVLQEELLQLHDRERRTMLFITHSIDEAIVLGDRVAVMTTRPGRVKEILPIDFKRPRDPAVVRSHAHYAELRNYIWNELRPTVVEEVYERHTG